MQSEWQKNLELVVKVLLAVVAAVVALWLAGWLLRLISGLFLGLAGLFVALLKFVVPVALVAGLVYVIVSSMRPKPVGAGASAEVMPPVRNASEPVVVNTAPAKDPVNPRATVELEPTPDRKPDPEA